MFRCTVSRTGSSHTGKQCTQDRAIRLPFFKATARDSRQTRDINGGQLAKESHCIGLWYVCFQFTDITGDTKCREFWYFEVNKGTVCIDHAIR